MTLDEAKTVAGIMSTADGGCNHCVESLMDYFVEAFPQFEWCWVGCDVSLTEKTP